MLKIKLFAFNDFGVNTMVVYDSDSRDAMVVDPGMQTPAEFKLFDDFIAREKLNVQQVVNTHLHLDHCIGINHVRKHYGATAKAHTADLPIGRMLRQSAMQFGFTIPQDADPVEIDVTLEDGDTIAVGHYTFTVLHMPGHSPGGIALYCASENVAIVGDSIFKTSIGRTDLPGGNHRQLIEALHDKILTLPPHTTLVPGHGPTTTVDFESKNNPFLL